ncbi:MAG: hypothetical protein ACFE94_11500 [Candidatus Hodarchaeota archaeon]
MSDLSNIIRERNVKWGILISALVTTASYITISIISIIIDFLIYTGFFLFADLEFLLGAIFGLLYFFKNREPHQEILKYGIIVGIFGGVLSCMFISIYQTVLAMIAAGTSATVFFLYLGYTLLSGAVIGLLAGALMAFYYVYKEMKGEKVGKEHFDDEFFKDLIDK